MAEDLTKLSDEELKLEIEISSLSDEELSAELGEDKPGIVERLFDPISKQVTGQSLSERTDFLQKKRLSLGKESEGRDKPMGTAEFVTRTIPAGIADIATEFVDLSPFDIGLIAATGGAGKLIGSIPLKGTTVGRAATKLSFPISKLGKGFGKSVEELGRLEQTLKRTTPLSSRGVARGSFTREQFNKEFLFSGKGPTHPLINSNRVTGGATSRFTTAQQFAGERGAGRTEKGGVVEVLRKNDIPPENLQELTTSFSGNISSMGLTPIESFATVPSSIKDPFKYLVDIGIINDPSLRTGFKLPLSSRSIAEATKPVGKFTPQGVEINKTPRTDLVPSINRSIPPEAQAIIQNLAKKETEILAAKRGIIPSKTQVEMSKGVNAQEAFDSWTPGATANSETMFAMRINLIERLGKLGDKPSKDAVEALSRDFIRGSSVASETGRTLGSLNRIQSTAAEQLKYLHQQVGKLDLEAQGAAKKLFKNLQTPGFWDKFMEFRTASLLTSIFTQERNILGNTIGRAYRLPEKTLAGGVNLIESKLRGIPQENFVREGIADTVGMIRGFRPAMQNMFKALQDETFMSESRVAEAVRFNRAIPGLTGKIIRLPFRALNAMDEFFATLASSGSLESQAIRQAMKEGSKNIATRTAELVKNPTPDMIAIASKDSLVDTFRTPLQGSAKLLQGAIQKNKFAKFEIPFFRTPVNLFKWSWRRGPTGIISPGNWKEIVRGTPEQRSEAIARIAIGQLTSAGIYLEAMQGNITGRLSSNPDKRKAMMRQGIQPYSIKIGDKYISYRSYEPVSSMLGLMANAAEISKEKDGPIDAGTVAELVGETVKMLKDQTFLRGVSTVMKALEDPERFGERFVQEAATSLIPTGIGYISRLHDPVIRDPGSVPEAIKARIPGFSKGVPPRLDVWGRPITKEGTLSQRAFLPSGVMTAKPDLTEAELLSFEKFPRRITKRYKGLDLTTKERNMVTIVEGGIQKNLLDRLVSGPGYQSMDIGDQQKAIDFIFTETRSLVRTPFFGVKFKSEFRKLKTDQEKIRLLEKATRRKLIKR